MARRFIVGQMLGLLLVSLLPAATAEASPGRYIVVLKDSVSDSKAVASEHARRHDAQVSHVYRFALKGYAAAMSERAAERIAADSRVDYVEEDGVVYAVHHCKGKHAGDPACDPEPAPEPAPDPDPTCGSPQTLPWGIARIQSPNSHTNGGTCVSYPGVHAYIIDTGVDAAHRDLHVVDHVNFAGGPNKDCNGHGTHVAGTVAALDNTVDVVGAAPGAKLVGVKVLGCSGSGTWSGVIAGIDWVTGNAEGKDAIANMSLGGGANTAVDDAVKGSANSGVVYSVAAGNDGANACNYSPARAGTHGGVITVAATNSSDQETSWSNFGTCVDLWAPGASILSTSNGGGTTTMSGTSMAAPHAGGVSAYYLSSNTGASAGTVETALKAATVLTGTKSKDGRAITLLHAGAL